MHTGSMKMKPTYLPYLLEMYLMSPLVIRFVGRNNISGAAFFLLEDAKNKRV